MCYHSYISVAVYQYMLGLEIFYSSLPFPANPSKSCLLKQSSHITLKRKRTEINSPLNIFFLGGELKFIERKRKRTTERRGEKQEQKILGSKQN